MKIEVEVSARHIHLNKDDYALLFGPDSNFAQLHELSQSGEFATDKKVQIISEKSSLEARFLSPFREQTQVEISQTDAFSLGVDVPYAIDSDEAATNIIIKGTHGQIERKALIIARRHLHCNQAEAKNIGLDDGQRVSVKIKTSRGTVIFSDIEVKVSANYDLRIHLDTDEGNAAGIKSKTFGELILE